MEVKLTFQDDRGESPTKTKWEVIVSMQCDKRPTVLIFYDKLF